MKNQIKTVAFVSCFLFARFLSAENYNSLAISADLMGCRNEPVQQETSTIDKSFIGIDNSYDEVKGEIEWPKEVEILSVKWEKKPGYAGELSFTTLKSNLQLSGFMVRVGGVYYVENGPSTISFFSKKPKNLINPLEFPLYSFLYNGELNYTVFSIPYNFDFFSFGWILGARGIYLEEKIGTTFNKETDKATVKVYRISTINTIVAAQLGGVITWNPTAMIRWDFGAKVGAGYNINSKQTEWGTLESPSGINIQKLTSKGEGTIFLADSKISLTYQPTRFLGYRVSCHALYLRGIASPLNQTAPDKDATGIVKPTPVIEKGQHLSYGYSFGIVLNF
jgi:hypothetical protein